LSFFLLGRARILVGLGALLALIAIPATASAKTERHFFGQNVSFTSSDTGFSTVDALYNGNSDRHGTKVIGHARLTCVFTSQDRALCNGKIELPGGTLLANHVIVANTGAVTKVEINGGTREFAGANGYVRTISTSDTTENFTIVLR
jgi:hypothetical protein